MADVTEERRYLADFLVFVMTSFVLLSAVPLIEDGKAAIVMIIFIVSALVAWRWRTMFGLKKTGDQKN